MYYDEDSVLSSIWRLLSALWDYIQKVWYKIINFFQNIVNFFKNKKRLKQLQDNNKLIATVVKTNLENGNYNVVNCLFDTEEGVIVNPEEDALIMEAGEIDQETSKNFGDKAMIVLK